ncbi:hypothetical protein [Mumia sp. Pv 4-285]|uniref:hypothetical protein n=1 Tax=Mumia qirimensis TaxID=3234852 RepID=UPI00351D33E9
MLARTAFALWAVALVCRYGWPGDAALGNALLAVAVLAAAGSASISTALAESGRQLREAWIGVALISGLLLLYVLW